ncbi:MAG: MerC domain-containing protein [Pseudopedobacter saltans]|uniref:MerC domain-containing protein n=1 Tax=Pseudopedobacter saltans TaxID=151895 RepID=A0A2W5H6K6_9SPHI|nr:MAG: MerC domain-containing protein [Pseudopedobacter saltans]
MKGKINWDKVGVTASLACAVHCLALPLILTSLPILGIDLVNNEAVEITMIGLAFIIGIVALWKGRKEYNSTKPILLFSIGIACLIIKEIFHEWHNIILIPAVVFILWAHYTNYRMIKSAKHVTT